MNDMPAVHIRGVTMRRAGPRSASAAANGHSLNAELVAAACRGAPAGIASVDKGSLAWLGGDRQTE